MDDWDSNTQDVEAGCSEVQGQLWLLSEFKDILGYEVSRCFKTIAKKKGGGGEIAEEEG